MTAADHPAPTLVARPGLWSLLTRPRESWPSMADCPMTGGRVFLAFAVPLAAVPAAAKLIGLLVFGLLVDGVLMRPAPWLAVLSALLIYGLALASVLILAKAVQAFSVVFNGEQGFGCALKLAVVGSIPGWLGGIFLVLPAMGLLPPLGALSALATLYGLYVLYVGLPPVMHVTRDKAPVYAGLAILTFLALWGANSLAMAEFNKLVMIPAPGASIDLGKGNRLDIGAARKTLHAALSDSTPPIPAVSPDELQSILPAQLTSGFVQQSKSTSSAKLGRLSGSMATGVYAHNGDVITLEIVDTGMIGGLTDALKLAVSKDSATGYQKAGQVDGRMTLEKYDRTSNTGEYDVLVASRFLVQARGRASVEILRDATIAVPFDRLEAFAKG